MNKYNFFTLLLTIVFVNYSCNKCDEIDTRFQFSSGCIPDNLQCYEDNLFTSNITIVKPFIYDFDDKLTTSFEGDQLIYNCGILHQRVHRDSEIDLKETFFEDINLDFSEIVLSSSSNNEKIKLTFTESRLKKFERRNITKEYYWDDERNNIDSVIVSIDDEINRIEIITYDNNNHPYKNLGVNLIDIGADNLPRTKNNSLKIKRITPLDRELISTSMNIINYTDEGYPEKISSYFITSISNKLVSILEYSYIECI